MTLGLALGLLIRNQGWNFTGLLPWISLKLLFALGQVLSVHEARIVGQIPRQKRSYMRWVFVFYDLAVFASVLAAKWEGAHVK